jgi:hypothetical protein
MRFTKDVLRVGDHFANTDADTEVDFDVTPEKLIDWARKFSEIRAAGFSSDMFDDHRPVQAYFRRSDAKPHDEAIGELLAMEPTDDGQAMRLLFDLTAPEAIKRAKADDHQLSFRVFGRIRTAGKEWEHVLGAFDMVPLSCDCNQGPFVSVSPQEGVKAMATTKSDGFKKLVNDVRELGLGIPADTTPETLPHVLVSATADLAAKATAKRAKPLQATTGVFGGGGPSVLSLDTPRAPEHIGVPPASRQCDKQQAAAKRYVDEQAARMPGTFRS